MLASRVRNLVRSSVTVSPDEVKAEFIRKNRQINLEYIRFTSRRQEAEVAPTDEEIAAFAAKNEAKLKEIYEQKKFLLREGARRSAGSGEILVKLPNDADEKADKATLAKAEALVEKLKRGAKSTGKNALTFAELAKQSSDDTATKARGGDLGWRARGGTNLQGEAEDKLFDAKSGAIVGPLKGTDGYIIAKVEGSREGHVPFDMAKTGAGRGEAAAGTGRGARQGGRRGGARQGQAEPDRGAQDRVPAPQRHPGGQPRATPAPRRASRRRA